MPAVRLRPSRAFSYSRIQLTAGIEVDTLLEAFTSSAILPVADPSILYTHCGAESTWLHQLRQPNVVSAYSHLASAEALPPCPVVRCAAYVTSKHAERPPEQIYSRKVLCVGLMT